MILSKTTIKGALTTSVVTVVVFGPVLYKLPKSDLKRCRATEPLIKDTLTTYTTSNSSQLSRHW